ncbi:DUF4625 domain-containing protein [Paenimyroides ceti]
MKNFKYAFVLFLSGLTFVSCSDDDSNSLDTEKPTVQIVSPTVDQEIEPGTSISLKALLSDNEALASYKLEVHSAEDGHQHKVSTAVNAVEFHYEQSFTIENGSKTFEVNQQIPVPADAKEGHYHVGVFCIDKAGNQNQQFIEIYIGEEHDHAH